MKDSSIIMRVTGPQKAEYERRAAAAGMKLTPWIEKKLAAADPNELFTVQATQIAPDHVGGFNGMITGANASPNDNQTLSKHTKKLIADLPKIPAKDVKKAMKKLKPKIDKIITVAAKDTPPGLVEKKIEQPLTIKKRPFVCLLKNQ